MKPHTSLYQNCINLRRRLASVPGFDPYLREMDQEELESGEETDPVTSMWNMLRQGFPLMAIYNASRPAVPLKIDRNKLQEGKWPKAASFQFLNACIYQLGIPAEQCFLITDLYGIDTTGFVKVLKVIDRVLNVLQERGVMYTSPDRVNPEIGVEPVRKSHSEMIVQELVNTERDYVQYLETLQAFKDQLDQSGILPGDVIHDIFLNLNALLDFQQRFLIRIEQQNALDPALQNWGALFVQYQDGFRVYEPFIGNQHQCNETVTKNWTTIEKVSYTSEVQGMVGSVTVLTGFLLKPFQRLSKYPLLLDVRIWRGASPPRVLTSAGITKAIRLRQNARRRPGYRSGRHEGRAGSVQRPPAQGRPGQRGDRARCTCRRLEGTQTGAFRGSRHEWNLASSERRRQQGCAARGSVYLFSFCDSPSRGR